jgi:hypothetical protein
MNLPAEHRSIYDDLFEVVTPERLYRESSLGSLWIPHKSIRE